MRPYTGNSDPTSRTRPGTKRFQDWLCFLFQMRNLGIYSNRTVRGSGSSNPPLSVHATWRAMDTGGTPEQCKALINFLYAYRDRLISMQQGSWWHLLRLEDLHEEHDWCRWQLGASRNCT
jgi:hypothetical protein